VRRKACNGDLADTMKRLDACGADPELIVLAKACLAPEAIDRPKDAQAVADGLTAYLDGVQERLRNAELAKAEAKAKAVEEAKRRRLTLALAATVLLAMTLGAGGWLWVKNERDARQAQVAREVNEAMNQATALSAQAKAVPVGGAALFAQAREQLQRALALVESGPADLAIKSRVSRLQSELDEEDKDRQLLAALDAARLAQAETLSENRFAKERAVPLFREAFRAYGLSAGEGEPKVAAERIRQRSAAIREAVIAALDEWVDLAGNPTYKLSEPNLDWLRAVVTAAEPPDNWTRELRVALAELDATKRQKSLEKLAAEVDARQQPPRTLTRLARRLEDVDQAGAELRYATGPAALQLLRRAQQQYPADFWINQNLGVGLSRENATPHEKDEAVRFLTAAVALRPESPGALLCLGNALMAKGQMDEAIACYRKALELDPKYAVAQLSLGNALKAKGQVDEAIACFKKAIALEPKLAKAYNALGSMLCDEKRDYDGAIACFRNAIELDPKLAVAQFNLGLALRYKGQLDEAIACFRKAIELDSTLAAAQHNLGVGLRDKGQLDEAIACFRKAIELDPKDAFAHSNLGAILCDFKWDNDAAIVCFRKAVKLAPKEAQIHTNLGIALRNDGQVDEAIACYRKAIALDPKLAGVRTLLADAQLMAAAQDKLPLFLKGQFQPTSNDERLGLCHWCRIKKLNRTATGLYTAAFAADPKMADDLAAGHRYDAACYAALAAGQREDAAKLDDNERARLRKQALDWLRADLASRAKQLASGQPALCAEVQRILKHWQGDSDLAGIRDDAALAKLPAEERALCEKLWADVAAVLQYAGPEAQQIVQAGTLAQRSLALLHQNKYSEAEPLLRECLALRQKLQPDAWTTFNTQSLLGGALLGQKKYVEAEPLLVKGYAGMKAREETIPKSGGGELRIPEALDRLIEFYTATNKPEDLKKWRAERAK
jgi:serine/threonine-protein kinase